MYCSYYKKSTFFKRLRGCMGYCTLQKCIIERDEQVGKIPFEYCEGINGKCNVMCGVYIYFSKEVSEK